MRRERNLFSSSYHVVAALALAVIATAPAPARAHQVPVPPQVETVRAVFTEVSVYSLPHVVVEHEFAHAEGDVVVVERPEPQLVFEFKTVDHSHGTNVDAHIDWKLWEDADFPEGSAPRWVLAHEMNHIANNVQPDIRRAKQKTFDSHGVKTIQIELSGIRPVRRYKIEAHGKVYMPTTSIILRKPLDTRDVTSTRTLIVALRPRWGRQLQETDALPAALAMLGAVRDSVDTWRTHIGGLFVATRSAAELDTVTAPAIYDVLAHGGPALGEDVSGIARRFLEESSRAKGEPPPAVPPTTHEVLGVPRPGSNPVLLRKGLLDGEGTLAKEAGLPRNLALVAARVAESRRLASRLGRLGDGIELSIRALTYLWWVDSGSELSRLLGRLERAAGESARSAAEISAELDDELGRDAATGGWVPIETSRIYTERVASATFDSPRAAAMALRGLYADLATLAREAAFRLEVLARASGRAARSLAADPRYAAGLAPGESGPDPGLETSVSSRVLDVKPGEVQSFSIRVRNVSGGERPISITEGWTPPAGWQTRLTEPSFRLRAGEEKTIGYSIAPPYYAHEPMNRVAVLRVGFSSEGSSASSVSVLVRLVVGGIALAPPTEEAPPGVDGLLVSTDQPEVLDVEPGSVSLLHWGAIHHGSPGRQVVAKILTPLPQRWIATLTPEGVEMDNGQTQRFTLAVTAPATVADDRAVDLLVGIGYADEFDRVDRVAFRKVVLRMSVPRSQPLIDGGEVRTFYARTNAATTLFLELANAGNVDDTFDLFVDEKPRDWYVHLDRAYMQVSHKVTPVLLPITVRPPLDANTGEAGQLVVRAVSIRHPEIYTRQIVTVAVRSNLNMALNPEVDQYLAAPGSEGVIRFKARNIMDEPVHWTMRISPETIHPEWFTVDAPLATLEPDQERDVDVRVSIPPHVPTDLHFPLVLMALDEHGGQIVTTQTVLRVTPRHRVILRVLQENIVRTPGLVIMPIEVSNGGTEIDRVAFHLVGKRTYWARLSHRIVDLNPGGSFVIRLNIRVPPEAQYGQDVELMLKAQSLKDSSASDVVHVGAQPATMRRVNASTDRGVVRF